MTPYEISLILHFHTAPRPAPPGKEPLQQQTIDRLVELEILANGSGGLLLTSRGHAYVEGLRSVPLPKVMWAVEFPKQLLQPGPGVQTHE